jgi:hypothetical protein
MKDGDYMVHTKDKGARMIPICNEYTTNCNCACLVGLRDSSTWLGLSCAHQSSSPRLRTVHLLTHFFVTRTQWGNLDCFFFLFFSFLFFFFFLSILQEHWVCLAREWIKQNRIVNFELVKSNKCDIKKMYKKVKK